MPNLISEGTEDSEGDKGRRFVSGVSGSCGRIALDSNDFACTYTYKSSMSLAVHAVTARVQLAQLQTYRS